MRITVISRRWSVKWISVNWRTTRRTIRTPTATRRTVPRQPRDYGVCRDVQSADQGAASAADGDPEGNYNGTEGISALPFNGIILAHSNESEWVTFRNNKNNEAFLDRVYIVKVPYCLRVSEEIKIYDKLLDHSELTHAPCAPGTRRRWRGLACCRD